MPSPVGHALGGLLGGWLVMRPPALARTVEGRAESARQIVAFGLLGMLPDVDFLLGRHSRETHGLGVALVVGLAVYSVRRWGIGRPRSHGDGWRWALAASAAYASHALLDWLGSDTSPPIGIQALWPFSLGFYQSDLFLFHAVDRRYWLPGFWARLVRMLAWELALLVPPVLLLWYIRRDRSSLPR